MTVSARVQSLRQESLDAVPCISTERAQLVTRWYREHDGLKSEPMRRAEVFRYLMEHITVRIRPGELIVGEKGPRPKAAPTYPELCCHSLADLDILDAREKTAYRVSAEDRQAYAESVIPFWRGKTMRERIFHEMTEEWRAGYEAGLFTEFM